MKELNIALLAVQKALQPVAKSGQNSHLKSSYATLPGVLDELLPLCHENGLLILQPTMDAGNPLEVIVQTLVIHVESGMERSLLTPMWAKDSTAQAHGSAITYARRYALMSLFGIRTSDDDGHAGSQPRKEDKPEVDPWPPIQAFCKGAKAKGYNTVEDGRLSPDLIEEIILSCRAITTKHKNLGETINKVGITGLSAPFWKDALALLPDARKPGKEQQ